MKILTELTATSEEREWREPRGVLQTVHNEPVSGFIRRVTLGEGGVMIRKGEHAVGIPLEELFKLAEAHEPQIQPPDEIL